MDHFTTEQFKQMQRFFSEGNTRSYAFRKKSLQTLRKAIQQNEEAIYDALYKDLHKSQAESYGTEIGFVYAEISHTLERLEKWMEPRSVDTPLVLFPSSSKIVRDAWGVSLIIAPWNYPFQLIMGPLIGAIAGGNCVVLKPSEFTVHTSAVIEKIIKDSFDPNYISVVQGDGATVIPQIMNDNRFDHVFFTGSIPVGRSIAKMAAEKLIPVTLELGGKSPCIVDKKVDIKTAAARITWGKFTNAGQTCVAPDHLIVHNDVKQELISEIKKNIEKFYSKDPSSSEDYGRIVNKKRFDALKNYLNEGKILAGGETNEQDLYIAPTLIEDAGHGTAVMKEEIFGPILPVISFSTTEEVMQIIDRSPQPLALYIFSDDEKFQRYFTENVPFGGGCINNTLVHLGNPELPFGGVGSSGSGQYHGQYSFETFTRPKAILKTANWLDPFIKYPPYKGKLKFFKWFLR